MRCDDCRAYINPFVRFYDDGTKWLCNFCCYINNTPQYYFSALTADGLRQDHDERAELNYGTIDFIATNEY